MFDSTFVILKVLPYVARGHVALPNIAWSVFNQVFTRWELLYFLQKWTFYYVHNNLITVCALKSTVFLTV